MARAPYPNRIVGNSLVTVTGSFSYESTGPTVDAEDLGGFGFTPAYVSAGVHSVTMDRAWPILLSCHVTISGVAAGTQTVTHSTHSYNATTGVLTITTLNSTGAATAPLDETRITFTAVFQEYTVLGNN